MTYSLAVMRTDSGPCVVLETDGVFYAMDDVLPGLVVQHKNGLLDILEQWDVAEPKLIAAAASIKEKGVAPIANQPTASDFHAPVLYPSKLVCSATNYYDHLADDMGIHDFDKTKFDILYFLKHSRAVVGSGPSVRYPTQSKQLDWEVELALVFGKQGRRIPVEEAVSYIAGYSIGLDLSARDWQFNPRHAKQFDLVMGKSFDDSSPVGPGFVPARYVDPTDLSLKLWVNGELKQNSHTKNMIWTLAEQISELSQHMTIYPGDILFTGSPGGVGWASGTYLKEGDRVEAEISGLGHFTVDIAPDPDAAAARTL